MDVYTDECLKRATQSENTTQVITNTQQFTYNPFKNWPDNLRGPYLYIPESSINVISVFDELYYDRADSDLVSPAMRKHLVLKLSQLDFKQTSGNIWEHKQDDVRCIIPKTHALGASPFDILRYTKKREQDFYILTPTQTACQFVVLYTIEKAVEKIGQLISRQPININRLYDYLESIPTHQDFLQAIPHLRYRQRTAVTTEPLSKMRALR